MDLEQELKQALRRVDPPEGFVERVLVRIENESSATVSQNSFGPFPRLVPRWVATGLLAASIGAVALGLGTYRINRLAGERAEGIRARQELLLAVRIASQKTNLARTAVQKTSFELR
ncbi:MAG: hypothetical protein ABI718_12050 [Acidobacteriota bacterium]